MLKGSPITIASVFLQTLNIFCLGFYCLGAEWFKHGAELGILSHNWLENRNSNITQELSRIFKAFSDFRLVAQIREEIEKVKFHYLLTD